MSSSVCSSSDVLFFFQAEDGIRDLVRSRGLGDVYKRQNMARSSGARSDHPRSMPSRTHPGGKTGISSGKGRKRNVKCEHGRGQRVRKECGGGSMCEHGRQRSQCKELSLIHI
eukprot:TRINITY_DN30806_c0_g1_i1.p1 TRINITY_DN30806_c0_g1~~TRINITY_DN30806_c0_g1_i1.p1  ORF type:complete len:113 (-),score=40.30 TRINITY_DN30806_c0_g1_i1:134-472(-)